MGWFNHHLVYIYIYHTFSRIRWEVQRAAHRGPQGDSRRYIFLWSGWFIHSCLAGLAWSRLCAVANKMESLWNLGFFEWFFARVAGFEGFFDLLLWKLVVNDPIWLEYCSNWLKPPTRLARRFRKNINECKSVANVEWFIACFGWWYWLFTMKRMLAERAPHHTGAKFILTNSLGMVVSRCFFLALFATQKCWTWIFTSPKNVELEFFTTQKMIGT